MEHRRWAPRLRGAADLCRCSEPCDWRGRSGRLAQLQQLLYLFATLLSTSEPEGRAQISRGFLLTTSLLALTSQVLLALAGQSRSASTAAGAEQSAPRGSWLATALGVAAGAAAMTTVAAADHEGEHGLDAGHWPWSHSGMLDSYDHASIRRGYQVYKQVRARDAERTWVSGFAGGGAWRVSSEGVVRRQRARARPGAAPLGVGIHVAQGSDEVVVARRPWVQLDACQFGRAAGGGGGEQLAWRTGPAQPTVPQRLLRLRGPGQGTAKRLLLRAPAAPHDTCRACTRPRRCRCARRATACSTSTSAIWWGCATLRRRPRPWRQRWELGGRKRVPQPDCYYLGSVALICCAGRVFGGVHRCWACLRSAGGTSSPGRAQAGFRAPGAGTEPRRWRRVAKGSPSALRKARAPEPSVRLAGGRMSDAWRGMR